MTTITELLSKLDALRKTVSMSIIVLTSRGAEQEYASTLHNAYPQLAAEIRRLEAELANESVRFADFRAHVNAVAFKAKQDTNEAMSLLVKFRAELAEAKKDSARLEEHSRILHWLLAQGYCDERCLAVMDLHANIDGDMIEACRLLMNSDNMPIAMKGCD